jgi:hypothetical protein
MNKKAIWTDQEFKYLKDNYLTMTDEEMSNNINKTAIQISYKRHHEGLGRIKVNRTIDWNALEQDYITEKDLDILADKYNANRKSIHAHLVKNNLYHYNLHKWNDKKISFLKSHVNILSVVEIAQKLKCPIISVKKKTDSLNIKSNIVYYYPNFFPYSKKETYLFELIKNRLDNNLLIDTLSVNKCNTFNLSKYCANIYSLGYEDFLITCFNINLEQYYLENCIAIYELYKNNKINLPNSFWNIEIITKFLRYKFKNYNENKFYEQYSLELLKKYGVLNCLYANNLNIYDLAKIIFPSYNNYPFLFKKVFCPDGYWDNAENRYLAIDYMVNSLMANKTISTFNHVTKFTVNVFKKFNLGGLLTNRLMYDILSEYLYKKTGKQYKEWEFHCVTNGYWKDIKNAKKAIKWMLEEKEHWDGVNIEWIKNNYGINLINKYGFAGMLSSLHNHDLNSSINELFMITYPDLDIFPWEFNTVTNGYWDVKENANQALKQLIEIRLKLSISDIPKYISRTYFHYNYPKFMLPLMKSYNGNIFNWIDSIYPNKFSCRDFGYIECLDGTIVKSMTEQMIHNYLINTYKNVKYLSNEKENEGFYKNTNYIPDWLIENNIVVEYLGLYKGDKNKNLDKYKIYNAKTKEKIKLAQESDLIFIFVYEFDLKNNFEGLKEKIKECA